MTGVASQRWARRNRARVCAIARRYRARKLQAKLAEHAANQPMLLAALRPERPEPTRYDVEEMTRRLVVLHSEFSRSDVQAGVELYPRCLESARALAAILPGPDALERAVSVIAHLSARMVWSQNVTYARMLLEAARDGAGCPHVGVRFQRAKAWAVATGKASPTARHGKKTLAFYRSMLGDLEAVCVDVWALRAALGRYTTRSLAGASYDKVAAAYRAAARLVGLAPRDLQAAAWVRARGGAD